MSQLTIAGAMVYADTAKRGFVLLDIARDLAQAEWVLVNNVFSATYTASTDRTLTVIAGARRFA